MKTTAQYRSTLGRRPGPGLLPLVVAATMALAAPAAHSATLVWTGGAGSANSFWDLSSNWSVAVPLAGDAASLGAADTVIRSGLWSLSALTGTGALTLSGGTLGVQGASSIGSLTLFGGKLAAGANLSVGSLSWTSGSIGNGNGTGPTGGIVNVAGNASLFANGHSVDYGETLNLNGGATLAGNGQLYIGSYGQDSNGAVIYGNSAVNLAAGKTFTILGSGANDLQIYGGGTFTNNGTVARTTGSGTLYIDSGFVNAGTLKLDAGKLQFRGTRGLDGTVQVASGATLHLNGGTTLASTLQLQNAGALVFDGLYNALTSGTLSLGGSSITLAAGSLGGAGSLLLSSLAWNGGSFGYSASLGGATSVNGPAALNSASHSVGYGHVLNLNGSTTWSDSGQLFIEGAGNFNGTSYAGSAVNLAAGKTLTLQGGNSLAYQVYGGGTLNNAGTIVKATGTALLYLDGTLVNTGTLRADAGSVQIRGTIDNRGEIHANGARVEISQPSVLLQWSGATETLTGGSYRVTGAQPIALNLGNVTATGAPALVRRSQANIFLEGSGAALIVTTTSPSANALSALASNQGVLSLTGGATLATTTALSNQGGGKVAVGSGSALSVGGAYGQTEAASSTFVAGSLGASALSFLGGTLSAGQGSGLIGSGALSAASLSLGAGARFEEDLGTGSWDTLSLQGGNITLAGTLVASFASGVAAGSYRFLSTDSGSVSGVFGQVLTNLDPSSWLVAVTYGANNVTLTVSAVPEPSTYWMLLAALVLLALYLRRSKDRDG